jgi:hypothetical protein
VSTDDDKVEAGAGDSSWRAQSPTQEKVKQEMAVKVRQPLLLAGNTWLVWDFASEMQKPASLATGLRTLPISKQVFRA